MPSSQIPKVRSSVCASETTIDRLRSLKVLEPSGGRKSCRTDSSPSSRVLPRLFGWQFTEQPLAPHPRYVVWKRGEKSVGGLLPIGPGWNSAPRWQVLFQVDDLEAAVRRVVDAGGTCEFGPLDVPRAGLLTSVRDPGGALHVLVQPHQKWVEHVALEDGFVVSSTMIMGYGLRVTSSGDHRYQRFFCFGADCFDAGPTSDLRGNVCSRRSTGESRQHRIFRWSTEEERAPLIAALNTPPPPPPAPAPPPPAAAPAPAAPPPDGDAAPAPDRGNTGRAGRAGRGGGRDGRGGRGDAPPPPPPPITPIGALTNAIAKAPTIGYIWTDEATGYSIKLHAYRLPLPAGGERVVLATSRVSRRLDSMEAYRTDN